MRKILAVALFMLVVSSFAQERTFVSDFMFRMDRDSVGNLVEESIRVGFERTVITFDNNFTFFEFGSRKLVYRFVSNVDSDEGIAFNARNMDGVPAIITICKNHGFIRVLYRDLIIQYKL